MLMSSLGGVLPMWKVLGHLEVKFVGGLFMGVKRWCSRGGLVLLSFLIPISCVGNTRSCHLQGGGVPHHWWTKWIFIWILVLIFVWGSQTWRFMLHILCISTYVYWVVPIICQYVGQIVIWFLGVGGFQSVYHSIMT